MEVYGKHAIIKHTSNRDSAITTLHKVVIFHYNIPLGGDISIPFILLHPQGKILLEFAWQTK